MIKSFVLYTRVEVEGELVDCIYFINGQCWAQPFATRAHKGPDIEFYKPTEQDQKDFCKNSAGFQACPRFLAYQEHLKAAGLVK